jgi:malate dehydrogenase
MVSIIGSGNVGANTAFFIAENGADDILLYDVKEGVSKGKALDMMETAPIRSYRTKIRGTDSIDDVTGSDVVVLAAGSVRRPGMKRSELYDENAPAVEKLARDVSSLAPESVVIVATEPVDLMTMLFVSSSRFPRERVLGVGGILDVTRLRYAVSRNLNVSMDDVSALAIGPHDERVLLPPRFTSVSGVPVLRLMGKDHFATLVGEVARAGDFIVEMARASNAYYAPSAAMAELAHSVVRNTRRILCASLLLRGEFGIDGAAMSVPVQIGKGGVQKVLAPALSAEEQVILQTCARDMKSTSEGRSS